MQCPILLGSLTPCVVAIGRDIYRRLKDGEEEQPDDQSIDDMTKYLFACVA
jgi:hypothetical protein